MCIRDRHIINLEPYEEQKYIPQQILPNYIVDDSKIPLIDQLNINPTNDVEYNNLYEIPQIQQKINPPKTSQECEYEENNEYVDISTLPPIKAPIVKKQYDDDEEIKEDEDMENQYPVTYPPQQKNDGDDDFDKQFNG